MNFLCKSLSVVGVNWMTTTCRSFSAASSEQINWRHCISMSYGDCSWDHELHRDDHHESWWSFSLPSLPISPVSLSTSPLSASWSSLHSSTSARTTSSLVNQHGNEFNVFLLGSNGPCSSIFRPAPCLLCLFSSIRKLTFTAAWTHIDVAQGWLVTKPCKNLVTSYGGLPRSTTTSWGVGESHNDKKNKYEAPW